MKAKRIRFSIDIDFGAEIEFNQEEMRMKAEDGIHIAFENLEHEIENDDVCVRTNRPKIEKVK